MFTAVNENALKERNDTRKIFKYIFVHIIIRTILITDLWCKPMIKKNNENINKYVYE